MNQRKHLFLVLVFALSVHSMPPSSRSSYGFHDEDLKFMVGKCTAAEYFKQEQQCARDFFLSIRENGGGVLSKCSSKYRKMRTCKLNVFENCLQGSMVESFLANHKETVVENFLTLVGTEEKWCKKGGLGIPDYVFKGTHCHPIYAYTAKECLSRYQNVFNSQTTYRRLCREYNQAQTCLFRNLITHCSFSNRPLGQMMALLIEVKYDYQPYCFQPQMNARTYDELSNKKKCPTYAHADVMFLLDVSNETSIQEFLIMKLLIRRVAIRLNYGMSGIRIGLEQFNEKTLLSLQMNKYDTKRSFLRGLKRTRRMNSDKKGGRLTGESLMKLADTLFNMGEESSTVRPFHTPIVVVLSTGRSRDTIMEEEAVSKLITKGVHVVRFGPTYKTNRFDRDVTYHVNNTMNFTGHYQSIVKEICLADRLYRDQNFAPIEEAPSVEHPSMLAILREHIFSRLSGVHLPLLWEPDSLEYIPFTVTNNSESTEEEDGFPGLPLLPELGPALVPSLGSPFTPPLNLPLTSQFGPAPLGPPLVDPFENSFGSPLVEPYESNILNPSGFDEGLIGEGNSNTWGRFR